MNGILGNFNLIDSIVQSVARCSTDRYSSVTLNLCNRSELETCYVDIAVTTSESVISNNSRYIEYNAKVAPNTSFSRDGILLSQGEFLTLVYRSEDPRCLTATVWGIESGEDQGLDDITFIQDPAPVIATTVLPVAEQGLAYEQQIVATDNRQISSYNITSGSLPTGLSLDTATGVISGVPGGADADYTFTVTVTDNTEFSTDQELTITKGPDTSGPVFDPVEIEIPFNVNQQNSYTIVATDPSTPITFGITSGTLPTGITLSSEGVLSGTAADGQDGSYPLTVTATDAVGNTTDLSFTFEVLQNSARAYANEYVANTGGSITTFSTPGSIDSVIDGLSDGDVLQLSPGTYTATRGSNTDAFRGKDILICGTSEQSQDVLIEFDHDQPSGVRDHPIFGDPSTLQRQMAFLSFKRIQTSGTNYISALVKGFGNDRGKMVNCYIDLNNGDVSWLYDNNNDPDIDVRFYNCTFANYANWDSRYSGRTDVVEVHNCLFDAGYDTDDVQFFGTNPSSATVDTVNRTYDTATFSESGHLVIDENYLDFALDS